MYCAEKFQALSILWDNIKNSPASNKEIAFFEQKYKVFLPEDFKTYLLTLNGTNDEYDAHFFRFLGINSLNNLEEMYADWEGEPNYQELLKFFPETDKYFVFADYQMQVFSYCIGLHPDKKNTSNKIFVLCGEEFLEIASSFSEFLEMYFLQNEKLFFA